MLSVMLRTRNIRMQASLKSSHPQQLGRLHRTAKLTCRAVAVTERVKLGSGNNAVEFTPLINVCLYWYSGLSRRHVPTCVIADF
jgi:hypothetical protein